MLRQWKMKILVLHVSQGHSCTELSCLLCSSPPHAKQVLTKEGLWWSSQDTEFTKPGPWNEYISSQIFSKMNWVEYTKHVGCPLQWERKPNHLGIMWVTKLNFHGPCFPLKKMTDKYSRSECWIDIFAKMNGLSLSSQEKHPAMSITSGDIQTFKQKLEFWKTYLLSWKRVLGSDLWEVNRQLVNIEVRQHLGELRSWASCCLQWQLWSSRTILDLPLGAGLQIPYCSDPRNDHMIKFDVISV